VYEHMEWGSLASLLSDSGRAAAFGATGRLVVAADVSAALAFLHDGGRGERPANVRVRRAVVLHRDVNSSNVLLGAGGRAKLGDFGLSAMVHEADADSEMVFSGDQLVGQVRRRLKPPS